jgi:hypothetical protein
MTTPVIEQKLKELEEAIGSADFSLTLRDHFAMAALTGLLAGNRSPQGISFAQAAYIQADEMLKARERV